MIEFVALNKEKLNQFINSKEFSELNDLPISYHRAVSHIHNPRVEKDDTLLLLAYIDKHLCGYLGTVPDRYYIDSESFKRGGWMSCIWVSDSYRGKGIAYKLLAKMFELWEGNLVITNYTETAKRIYEKSGYFSDHFNYEGLRGYLKLNLHQLLPDKNPKWEKYKWFLHAFDFSFNVIIALRLRFVRKKNYLADLVIEHLDEIDEEVLPLIDKNSSITKRGECELNWIIKYPWIKVGDQNADAAKKYAFSSYSKDFQLLNLKIKNSAGKPIAFLMMHVRDRQMRVPYVFYEDKEVVVRVIYAYMLTHNIRTLTLFNKDLVQFIKEEPSPFFIKRKMLRQYMITKKLAVELGTIDNDSFQDGDGDSAFT